MIHDNDTNAHLSLDTGDGTCVAMTTGQIGGFWDDKPCSEKYGFFCEKPRPDITPPTNPPTPPPAQGCADGWTALPHFRNCYKVNSQQPMTQPQPWVFTVERRSVVSRPVLIYGMIMIPCSSSTMWTGPRRRAGEQPMRTVSQEGGIL